MWLIKNPPGFVVVSVLSVCTSSHHLCRYDAQVFVDECHATGFLGPRGRGTPEHFGVTVDVINSTLGKALGGATGGYTTGSAEVVGMLRQKGRPYLFSNSIAPAVVGASIRVFERLLKNSDLVAKLRRNTHHFRDRMGAAGFKLSGNRDHPICPVMIYDAAKATAMADAMLMRDIYVIGFSFPVVPKGQARIRCQMSAAHTTAQIDAAVDAFIAVGREQGVIS
jgi:glycine C-acetyltransferase